LNSETVLTYKPQPSKPELALPAFTCDCHVHVFGPARQFPYAASRNFTPADAPKETLFSLHRHLGIERCVIVQSMVHGMDNTVVEDAIVHGEGRYLGVALVPVNVADAELQRLSAVGFRAVRFNFMQHLGSVDIEQVIALTPRLKTMGMHLQVHFESVLIHSLAEPLSRSAVPVVIDHMGRVDARLGADGKDFCTLFNLLKNPMFSVKISGIDRIDAQSFNEAKPYSEGRARARELLHSYPEQCLWGTDWPHPNHTHVPDDGILVDALSSIAHSQNLLMKLLVHNPQRIYQFNHD
jgi:2-pyrone-4,6-dicarboxylate lactonase